MTPSSRNPCPPKVHVEQWSPNASSIEAIIAGTDAYARLKRRLNTNDWALCGEPMRKQKSIKEACRKEHLGIQGSTKAAASESSKYAGEEVAANETSETYKHFCAILLATDCAFMQQSPRSSCITIEETLKKGSSCQWNI